MSGRDEFRPICDKCTPQRTLGTGSLDARRLLARNTRGRNITMITSLYDESLTGIRVVEQETQRDENKVISKIYCTYCGHMHRDEDFVFSVKRYIYKYESTFGASHRTFETLRNAKTHPTNPHHAPDYDEYLGEDDGDYCTICNNHEDDCTCCEHCGYDRRTCGCEED